METNVAADEMDMTIRCRQCRNILIQTNSRLVQNSHGMDLQQKSEENNPNCLSLLEKNEIFLSEENLPEWINAEILSSQWTKGKLKCSKCDSRVGSFDFVSGNRCNCQQSVLPSVHFVRSKVDCPTSLLKLNNG